MVELKSDASLVRIYQGELVGFEVEGHQFIHQKGSPGWRSSDTEMFPIIGPVDQAGFRVQVPRNNAIQDQHGLLRELPYVLISESQNEAVYVKEYRAGTPVENSKYPEKSTKQHLEWPYGFQFEKSFSLKENQLEITFKISGEQGMPFMLGYHPAFKLQTQHPTIVTPTRTISLDEVIEVGSRALQVADTTSITLKDKHHITIQTEGFGHFMCWTEVRNMVCIEPITFYPYAVEQREIHLGFDCLDGDHRIFKVALHPKPQKS
ncbi:aldose 1-epimerase [Muricauda sp. JGD-17]|uniref:Aldose 1-epimerase n=1 Tax=Flagellimonas ochracea TaxID=2696472 RepID=A0A964TDN9_9FLAO|nr:aldose 1-epimerase [Allomuricauda ochracea]NAY93000.1 aldose 1-epimerase [Allomuricauda ochracea]